MKPITYTSEQPTDYAKALAAAKDADAVRAVTAAYGDLAEDANEIAQAMDDVMFRRWRRGLTKERRGEFAGEEFAATFGALQMPEVMFKVSMYATQFGVPWGLMYLRLKQVGKLPTRGDHEQSAAA
jgi:predicted TIM-barrel fold metal-dependent hydrolase